MADENPKKKTKTPQYQILGLGNPLLDISAEVPLEFLAKYDLKLDNCVLATEKELPVYDDLIQNHKVDYIAGGSTQNTIRICQWMLQEPGVTAYIGAVGDDEYGKQLFKSAEDDGVHTDYWVSKTTPTGKCACLIHEQNRSLVPHLAAAQEFDADHLNKEGTKKLWENASLVYSAGFFISHDGGRDAINRIAKHVTEKGGIYALNLAAPFVVTVFADRLLPLINLADFVFGNESEAEEFGKHQKFEDVSPKAVALRISEFPKKEGSRPRVVVITQGANPTIVATEGKAVEFPTIEIKKEDIVDTNGAGDAFVGGFLAALYREKDIETCVKAGQYAASVILGESGTSIPPITPKYEL